MRVVGLDLSLTGAGLVRIGWRYNDPLTPPRVESTVLSTQAADFPRDVAGRSKRLRSMASQVHTFLVAPMQPSDHLRPHLVLIEAPSYGSTGAGTHERAGLWWLVVARCTAEGIPMAEVAPNTIKTYALGKGSGKGVTKEAVFAAAARRYMDHLQVDDNNTADALLLADLAARYYGRALVDLPQTHTRASAAIRWPA